LDLAEEESGVPEIDGETPEWPVWAGYLRTAWRSLKDDRFYGAMGGLGGIYYTARSQYASDNGIALQPFLTFLGAMDEEYMIWDAERTKAASEAAKTE
jgi:hypothetical protein